MLKVLLNVAFLVTVLAPQVFAQDPSSQSSNGNMSVSTVSLPRTVSFASTSAVQGGAATGSWRPLIFGGFVSHAGSAFQIGGGAVKSNFMNHDNYGLQIDGAYNGYGAYTGFNDCDEDIVGFDCDFDARQIAISGAFLYMFDKKDNGWQPYAGGGIVIINTSVSFDADFGGFHAGSSSSVTDAGIQIQGGFAKVSDGGKTYGAEVRVQGAGGGGFVLLGRVVF